MQAAAGGDNKEDGFAPPSPRKVVTRATQRRRTADEQAREAKFYQDLSHPNTFAALVDDSASHLEDQLSQGPLAEADNMEEPGQDSEASSQNRLVPLSCLNAANPFAYSGESPRHEWQRSSVCCMTLLWSSLSLCSARPCWLQLCPLPV